MEINMKTAAMDVSLFCRLNMNRKRFLPLRPSEMGVLLFLSIPEQKEASPAAISSFFSISKPTAAAVLKKLTQHGYIAHRPCAFDGRSYTVTITEMGQHMIEEACLEYTRIMNRVRDQMGDEDFCKMISLISRANQILKDGELVS